MKLSNKDFLTESLNFPQFEFELTERNGKLSIFDSLRKKFLILTPEEWVRQHMIQFLVQFKNYPKSLFALEKGLKYNAVQKRFDILVLDRMGKPFLLIECKASDVKLSQKTAEQIAVYNKSIGAPFIGVSNGRQHLFLELAGNGTEYIQLNELPNFPIN
jgi:predicted type IV restriction endonuclease